MVIINGAINASTSKHALVTGATGEIGFSLVKYLIQKGFALTLIGNKIDQVEGIDCVKIDLSDPKDIDTHFSKAANFDQITHFFHLASPLPTFKGYFNDVRFYNVNVDAFIRISNYILPSMLTKRQGFILAFGSSLAINPNSDDLGIEYNIAKAGLLNYTSHLAKKYDRSGIRVIYYAPSPIATSYHSGKKYSTIPMGTVIDHLAEALDDEIKYPNGSIVDVSDGGAQVMPGKLGIIGKNINNYSANLNETQSQNHLINARLVRVFRKTFSSLKEAPESEIYEVSMAIFNEWDSLRHIALIIEMDTEFEITIPADIVYTLNSFHKFLEYVLNEIEL